MSSPNPKGSAIRRRAREWWDALLAPTFEWIQLEPTTRCHAACDHCMRPQSDVDMSWDAFERVAEAFPRTRLVHLQGWGEPLLHARFFEMVERAKRADCLVSVTTNGMLIDEEIASWLVGSDLDVVAFSLSGIGPSNDRRRPGTRAEQVLTSMRLLDNARQHAGSETPAIHVAYLALRSALDELERLPDFLADAPVDETIVSVLSRRDDPEFTDRVGCGECSYACAERADAALFVSATGDVYSCVHAVANDEPAFGNVIDAPLTSIWRREGAVEFRRRLVSDESAEFCRGCSQLPEAGE